MSDQDPDRLWIGSVEAIRREKARRCLSWATASIALTVVAFLPLSGVGARLVVLAHWTLFGVLALLTLSLFARAGLLWTGRGSLFVAVPENDE